MTAVRHGRTAVADVVVALVLAGVSLVEIWVEPVFQTGLPGPPAAMTAIALLATLPIALRTRHPLPVAAAVLAGLVLAGLVGDRDQAGFPLFLSVGLVTWALATRSTGPTSIRAFALLLVVGTLYQALTFADSDAPADLVVPTVLLAGLWVAGSEVRRMRERASAATDRAALMLEEQAVQREQALQDERDRIARELHDVVASALSVVGVQAAAASRTVPVEDVRAHTAIATIERVSREAVLEMRRMLQVLRQGDVGAEPLPGARALPDLVAETTGSGLDVALQAEGDVTALAPGLQLTVLRIVQEALTNVRRHSGASSCLVRLTVAPSEVYVLVQDDGHGARPGTPTGHGLLGMAERARLAGGTLRTESPAGGGFRVCARLPRLL